MSSAKALPGNDIIVLNVGGYEYTTSRATLTKHPESMLARMFSGSLPTTKDDKGRYFIDRDGRYFYYILQYLRTGFPHLPNDFMETESLVIETDFYMLKRFSKQLEEHKQRLTMQKDGLEIVKVNVGGRLFVTTRKTLTVYPNSLLGRIFNGYQENEHRYQGQYFFDRDPDLFCHVLRFLRNEQLHYSGTSRESKDFLHNLLCEARFFKLQELVSTCMSLIRYCDES